MNLQAAMNASKLGLFGSQSGLRTTSHNISNVNTPGFSRQRPYYISVPGNAAQPGSGTGVQMDHVDRVVDELIERRILVGQANLGRLEARDRVLPLIENVFNDLDGEGISTNIQSFFDAVDTMAAIPTNPVGRREVLMQADRLAKSLQEAKETLSEAALPVDQELTRTVEEVNNLLQSIHVINMEVISQEASNQPAIDLKDQRQTLLGQLSNLVDIKVLEHDNGGVQVLFAQGRLVLDENYVAEFSRGAVIPPNEFQSIQIDDRTFEDVTAMVQGGKIKGLIEVRDEIIYGDEGFLTQLEEYVDAFRFQTNWAHSQGVGLNLMTAQTGVFTLGADTTSAIAAISGNDDVPPDLQQLVLDGSGQITVTFAWGSGSDVPDNLTLGSITVDPAADSIEDVRDAINAMAGGAFAASIDPVTNRFEIASVGASQYGVVSDTGGLMAAIGIGAFFTGSGISDFEVDETLLDNPSLVAAAALRPQDDDGDGVYDYAVYDDADNRAALDLATVRTDKVLLYGATTSLPSHFAGVVGKFGTLEKLNIDALLSAETAQGVLESQRDAASGVSLEEEMTNLLRFQRSFQASSKAITVADELFQTIMEMAG